MADGHRSAPHPMPVRRDLRFGLPAARIGDWNAHGSHITQFMNAMSLFFPEGERFFINSVRLYRDRVTDPRLQQAVTAFIGQEAMHGREHSDYNRLMAEAGLPAEALERRVTRLLERVKRFTWPSQQLSATLALEHLTAIMADHLLREPEVLRDADPAYARLWRWHALEETEHKAVAFDVWKTVMKPGPREYLQRVGGLVTASLIFWFQVTRFHWAMVNAAPQREGHWRGYGKLLRFLFVRPGMFRKLAPAWFAYFRPGFHPWQHDNRTFLQQLPALEQELQSVPATAA